MSKSQQTNTDRTKGKGDEAPEIITLLSNAAHYFLESVFIIEYSTSYRLVIFLKGQRLVDREYKTLKGARIAFARICRNSAFNRSISPEWTHFYHPLNSWLQERLAAELVDRREPGEED